MEAQIAGGACSYPGGSGEWRATDGIPPSGRRRVCRCRSSACRSMCCGFAFRGERRSRASCWEISTMGRALILINRGDYFQAGLIIRKGSFEEIKREGLDAFRETSRRSRRILEDRVHGTAELGSDQAAHGADQPAAEMASSGPAVHWRRRACHVAGGGVGINLAIQDAVATANLTGRTAARRTR